MSHPDKLAIIYVIQLLFDQNLIILLISSIFLRTLLKILRYFPLTVTNVQKVSSIRTFSLSIMEVSLIKSKSSIFLWSCLVWVNGSKTVTLLCRVMLHTMSWYVNNSFMFLIKSVKSSRRFMKISQVLSLSEEYQFLSSLRNWWTNTEIHLYPVLSVASR